ncbi:ribonuclease H2, subunit B [Roridomyces roridus]|uniref:Ribonuclease H2 subunit B n=1 Tax=Roridomyces roridus TaxID=1738132 RepID=A0AAD7CEU6_9AGAR|nr:ribonuclease H2, subunit B [Roridomyces roridus]KAJ7647086.1 ribonuclease H2, subunit B [Roridomyces roridus]
MATTHLAILPADALNAPLGLSSGSQTPSRFLRLPHPRTGVPSLFLPYSLQNERDAILEVQAVSPANPRSWFVGQEVVADGKLLVMTPVDPAFLLIPILQSVYPENGDQGMFRPEDEIFEDAAANLEETSTASAAQDPSLLVSKDDVMRFTSLRCCQPALKRICDVKEITEEITVYRFSPEKTVAYLRTKVERLSTPETTELSRTLIRNLAKDGLMEDGREELLKVGRIRAACDLVAQYTPHGIRNLLLASYDFAPLDAYFKSIADENAAMAVEKPAKSKPAPKAAATDKKRKSGASQGVEKLKKVNTEGMAKLSTFFTKKVPG